jgi:hypothetical protein
MFGGFVDGTVRGFLTMAALFIAGLFALMLIGTLAH